MEHQLDDLEIYVIRTFECELCLRFDSIMLNKEELSKKVLSNPMGIGTHLISHGDHMRIIYFNEKAEYLGDIISLNTFIKEEDIQNFTIPIYTSKSMKYFQTLQAKIQKLFLTKSYKICIVGPSYAGKTSLSIFLDTGIPERHSGFTTRSPTLKQSKKHVKLGNTKLTIFDMGGQKDYWDGWKEILPKSDKIIFMADGSANNAQEIAQALDLVISSRCETTQILVLLNKYDLVMDGYSKSFLSGKEILSKCKSNNFDNIWILTTSVFNGTCYNYNDIREEVPIQKIVLDFVSR